MTRDELRSILQAPYDRSRWLGLLPQILPTTQPWREAQPRELSDPAVASAAQIAMIPLADDRRIAVLEFRVTGLVDLQKNRAGLNKIVRRFIDNDRADAVLAFFVGDAPGRDDYRFSFAARTNAFSADGQLEQNETAPRRYTYLFGPGQPCRTAVERFELLRSIGNRAALADLIEAFKVEPLFKEFYRDYGRVFNAVENHIRPTLPEKEGLRLFTQRLFNRLMFLAFVERKGWLQYGQRTDYLAALWNDHTAKRRTGTEPANFHTDRLRPLFFEGLNQPDRAHGSIDPRFGSVPYLNGGLFEHAEDGSDTSARIRVPDEAIVLILDPESGLFSRYNFTVAESTPLEIQVAVDPEMLGKVFEELVTGRHEQGSYYTPKPIVSFKARIALVEHLADRCPSESRDALEKFVHDDDGSHLKDPEAVHRALVSVTVCDPACGSGAYLLGMLHELLDLRTRIFASRHKADPETAYQRRLQIIQQNLYGVDKDAFAVNIARLRLWLALVVEFEGETPPPLPNLDFKIEIGDALAAPAPGDVQADLFHAEILAIRDLKNDYLKSHGDRKAELRGEIVRRKSELKDSFVSHKEPGPPDAFHWAIEFAEVFVPADGSTVPGGFDIIVANPPYVRMELIKAQKPVLRKRFKQVHAERADLYVYFYARAHELLRPGGVAAFISSNKWLRAGYGESLRQHLLDAQAFRLVMDFGELGVFDTAATDAAIFLWQKQPRNEAPTEWAMVKDLPLCYREGVREHFQKLRVQVPAGQFGEGKPRLATSAAADMRGRMEQSGPRLGELFPDLICWGIKTGLNEAKFADGSKCGVFIIDQELRDALVNETPEAGEIIKPMLAGDDVRRYEVHFRQSYLIYTYHGVDIRRYKSVEKHLQRFRSFKGLKGETVGLEHRATKQEWYELQQPSQKLVPILEKPKLIYPIIGKEGRFVIDDTGCFINDKVFVLPTSDLYLLGVLNSSSAFSYLKETCATHGDKDEGGRLEFRAIYLQQLPIPDASPTDREIVGNLAKEAQALHGERRARSERFLRDLGLDPADSTSRNPLEQPWSLAEDDYAKRARKLHGRAPDLKLYEAARDETAALTERIAKVEAEIDARVAALYGLDAEDQRWAAQSAPADAKQTVFYDLLGKLKSRRAHFSLTEVQSAVNDAELALGDDSLKVYLSEATKRGLIHDAGRGWYSRLSEPLKLDPKPVRKLINATKKALPLLDFCAWSTVQLNPWLQHQLAQPVAFLYVPRETLESVGETLRDQGWDVAVNPGKHDVARDVRPGEKMVVLRPIHSKQPVPHDHHAAPEQVWVDLLVETEAIGLMDRSEARAALLAASDSGWLKMADLKRYTEAKYLIWEEEWPVN